MSQTKTPVIFLTYANDRDDYLHLLKSEARRNAKALQDLDKREYIRVKTKENANVEDVFEGFKNHPDEIAIFHFAGHAGGESLKLDEGQGEAAGLAQLMGEQKNLMLVVLNGCSTKEQVKGLLDAGVKAVIATSVKIRDDMAVQFAEQFYDALANKRTIEQAFQMAEAYLKTKPNEEGFIQSSGGVIDLSDIDAIAENEMPWALYINPDYKKEVFEWRLPWFRPIGLPQDMIQYIGTNFEANRYIVLVLDEMCKYNPDIYHQMVEQRGSETVKKDSREFPWLVIRNFPWPIGSQVRLLMHEDKPNQERLDQLVSTYIISGLVIYYLLLSELWDKGHKNQSHAKWPHLAFDKEKYSTFDFLGSIPALFDEVTKQGTPFMPEIEMLVSGLKSQDQPLFKAKAYLDSIRNASSPVGDDMLKETCLKCEQALSILLRAVSFLSRYRMLTVRNVILDKKRFAEVEYEIEMGPLNAVQSTALGLYQDDEYRRKMSFSDSFSVVIVSNEDRMDDALNLSPLIIDKNTFVKFKKHETTNRDDRAHIFLAGWSEGDRLYYIGVNHNFQYALNSDTDQIHTDQTQDDFKEGRNLKESEHESFGNDFGADFGLTETVSTKTEDRVFQMLKDQYDLLQADLNS